MSHKDGPDLEGMYPDWVYYENNFTIFDYPERVYAKYYYVRRPGVAFLHNSLPEKTDYQEPHQILVMIVLAVSTLIDLFVQGLCVCFLAKSQTLSRSVKLFLLTDTGLRIFNDFSQLYVVPCIINWFCVDDTNYPFSWLLVNQILFTVYACSGYLFDLLALGLSTNRVFAIFFNGLYYRHAERVSLPYICSTCVLIGGFYFSMLGQVRSTYSGVKFYVGYLFAPNVYQYTLAAYRHSFDFDLLTAIGYMGYVVVSVSVAFDALTFWRIRKMKKQSSNAKGRADFKLAILMITTHLLNAISILYYQLNTLFLYDIDIFESFLANLPSFFFPTITGATIAAFNHPFKGKSRLNRIFNRKAIQGTLAQSTPAPTNHETQVTQVDC